MAEKFVEVGEWRLTSARVAIHVPTATAVMADLHLGYTQARQRQGEAIPIVPLITLLAPLQQTLNEHAITRLVVAGDLFEAGVNRLLLHEWLDWLTAAHVELIALIPGNHDRGLASCRELVPLCEDGFRLGNWLVVHGDKPLSDEPVVMGHHHPCLRLMPETIAAIPCFLLGSDRLMLPAYSPEAAGANVLGRAEWGKLGVYAIAGDQVVDLRLLEDLSKKKAERRRIGNRRSERRRG